MRELNPTWTDKTYLEEFNKEAELTDPNSPFFSKYKVLLRVMDQMEKRIFDLEQEIKFLKSELRTHKRAVNHR